MERECSSGRDFPRCVRLAGGENLRDLAFQALTEYAGDYFYLNCVHAHTEAYYLAVSRANGIDLDDGEAMAGDRFVLPQPACGDSATLTVSVATAELLGRIAAALYIAANEPDGEGQRRLATYASESVVDALLAAIDNETLGLDRSWLVGAVDFVYAAPVSVTNPRGVIATLLVVVRDEVTCRERLERFLLTAVFAGVGEGLRLDAAKLHRNAPVEASLGRCAA